MRASLINCARRRNQFTKSNAIVASLLVLTCVQAQEYVEIAGTIELISGRDSKTTTSANPARSRRIAFTCTTGSNRWNIQTDFISSGESRWHFDGTNVYLSLKGVGSGVPTIYIWESNGGHPLGDAMANLTWLAFCSGKYLKRAGRLIPLPLDALRHTPDRFAYTDQTEIFDDELGLPRKIDLFTSKSLFQSSADDFHKQGFRGDRFTEWTKCTAELLEEGVLTFNYAVVESTNFLGWKFPTKFEYFQKERKHVQNADWFHRGVGTVKSIRLATEPENVFVAGETKTIVDSRFRDDSNQVSVLTYTTTNSFASTTNDPVLQEQFAERVKRTKRAQQQKDTRKKGIIKLN